jgi:hypothetical protein
MEETLRQERVEKEWVLSRAHCIIEEWLDELAKTTLFDEVVVPSIDALIKE